MNDAGVANSRKNKWYMALFLAMVVVGGYAGYRVYQWRMAPGDDTEGGKERNAKIARMTADEALAAIELKDVSIGHLENGPGEIEIEGKKNSGMAIASEGLEKLVKQLPTERLPVQDLAIARLLLLENTQKDVERYRVTARQATDQFLDLAPTSAVAHWLAARVELYADPANPMAVTDDIRAKAVKLLQKATELDPDNVVFWFALREAATTRRDAEPSPIATAALEKAYSLEPRNLFLITELLLEQAEAEDPEIEQTFANAREVLNSLIPSIKQSRRVDLGERIELAVKAVQEGQWRSVVTGVRIINNVVRPEEVAKSDITRINRHPLEYLVYEFSREFYAEYGRPTPEWTEQTTVQLRAAEDSVLHDLSDVLDLCAMDFDLNGLSDILVLQPGKLTVLGRSALDQPWGPLATLDVPSGMKQVIVADLDRDRRKAISAASASKAEEDDKAQFDKVVSATDTCHDADPDIVVFGAEGVRVVRNDLHADEDSPKLVVMESKGLRDLTEVSAGVLLDVDHDGELDLVFSSAQGLTIWQAGTAFSFTDTSEFSQTPPADVPLSTMVAVDWDRDADIDIVASEPSGKLAGYLENMRHGEFRWTALSDSFSKLSRPRKMALLEADGNASWDLLCAGEDGVHLYLSATPRSGIVNFMTTSRVSEQVAADVLTWDFDNDGYRDAVVWGESGLTVLRGQPKAEYAQAAVLQDEITDLVRTADCFDMDRDGDQDIVVATARGVTLLINEGGNANSWVTLYPLGQSDNKGRCNHNAIGSLVELRSGGWYQAQVVDSSTVHFGLGAQDTASQLRVVWTNGVPQDLVAFAGNVAICEPMILKGSCPYVYTMADGQFSFFTDCLWAAPIGMQTAEGTVAPTRSWEYLLVPGERLTPHDGSYWVMMTEELWEAGYFDHVQLIAIDHPANIEIYSNEKVGPGSIAEFKVHTVSQRRYPDRVVDQRGRDLRKKLQSRDGDFVKAFAQRFRQGLTPEHFIELDLGQLEDPKQITLFLTGWILPTDTSLNVAFAQDPETDGPRMPSVWVPDADGQWQEAIAYMGFPGGKTKTIAVDLSDAFLAEDYRVRIKTTAEIYWDEAFFAVDEPLLEMHQTSCELESAELAYRGFSAEVARPDEAPQMYDYSRVRRQAFWPAMRGRFTRYGAVTELIAQGDDQMAVLGAGDAMTIRFAVPKANPPVGWKRDFFLHSIGYDKDADLNTIYGQTVGPLPYRGMKSYPFGPDDSPPNGDDYQRYLQEYQTREQDPRAFWRQLMLRP